MVHGKCGRVGGVGVNHRIYLRHLPVYDSMHAPFGGGAERCVRDTGAVQMHDDHIVRREQLIGERGGRDYHQLLVVIINAQISTGTSK